MLFRSLANGRMGDKSDTVQRCDLNQTRLRGQSGMTLSDHKRILCIDDSQDTCELFLFILSNEGYQVNTANTIAEGWQMAQTGIFGLYLIDLSLADGSGLDLIQQVRSLDASTPIIVCSGDAHFSQPEADQTELVQAFLLKPVDPAKLVQIVAQVLSDRDFANGRTG
jgi:DNA-binding NtrC family response regulator